LLLIGADVDATNVRGLRDGWGDKESKLSVLKIGILTDERILANNNYF